MATITVTNSSGSDVYCADLYCTISAGGSVSTTRSVSDLSKMAGLQSLIAAGSVSVAVAYSDDEKASGLVDQGDTATTATGLGDMQVVRVPMTAGTPGTADDVTVYALDALPYAKFRVIDAWAVISTAITATTLTVRTAAAGGGSSVAVMDSAVAGRNGLKSTVTATSTVTASSTTGLFVRRSDRGVAGEVFIVIRPET